jgi:hypothetical protein
LENTARRLLLLAVVRYRNIALSRAQNDCSQDEEDLFDFAEQRL